MMGKPKMPNKQVFVPKRIHNKITNKQILVPKKRGTAVPGGNNLVPGGRGTKSTDIRSMKDEEA